MLCPRGKSIFPDALLSTLITVQGAWPPALFPVSWGLSHRGGGILWELGSLLHPTCPLRGNIQDPLTHPQTEAASGTSLQCSSGKIKAPACLPSTTRGFGAGARGFFSVCPLAASDSGAQGAVGALGQQAGTPT